MAHLIRILGSDAQFPCDKGENILDAALRAGIDMPYSCRKGVCGNCAGAVSSGQTQSSSAASAEATPPGQVLYCQCSPLSDLEIAPTAWKRVEPGARKRFVAKVFRNTRSAPDVSILHLRLPAGQRAKFSAGQYLQVTLPDGSKRSYSMANPPHESDALQLHIRHVAGGQFTQIVPHLAPGDTLEVELPYGHFELNEASEAPMLCVAGGTGFAPVKSLLDDLVRKKSQRRVTLVWGSRDLAGIYLPEAVQRWRKALPGMHFIMAIEDPVQAEAAGAFQGRADAAVKANFQTLAGYQAYCCGAPPMVAAVRAACTQALGLESSQFFSDVFVPGPAA